MCIFGSLYMIYGFSHIEAAIIAIINMYITVQSGSVVILTTLYTLGCMTLVLTY